MLWMSNTRSWNILSWNIRGINSQAKWDDLRCKNYESVASIICLQETKRDSFDQAYISKFCPNYLNKFAFSPSVGASGGLLICWNDGLFTGKILILMAMLVTCFFSMILFNIWIWWTFLFWGEILPGVICKRIHCLKNWIGFLHQLLGLLPTQQPQYIAYPDPYLTIFHMWLWLTLIFQKHHFSGLRTFGWISLAFMIQLSFTGILIHFSATWPEPLVQNLSSSEKA
jgi:hypothetical protein